jgi:hypothetical protein
MNMMNRTEELDHHMRKNMKEHMEHYDRKRLGEKLGHPKFEVKSFKQVAEELRR